MKIPVFKIVTVIVHLMFCLKTVNTISNSSIYIISERNFPVFPANASDISVIPRNILQTTSIVCKVMSKKPNLIHFNLGCSYSHFITSMLRSFGLNFYPNEIVNCVTGAFVGYHKGVSFTGKPLAVIYILAIMDLINHWEWTEVTWILDGFLGITANMVEDELDRNKIRGNLITADVRKIKTDYYVKLLRRPHPDGFIATCSESVLQELLPQVSSKTYDNGTQLPPWVVTFTDMPTTTYWNSELRTQITYLLPKRKSVLTSLSFTANFSEFLHWDRVTNICRGSEIVFPTGASEDSHFNDGTSESRHNYREIVTLEYFDVVYNELKKDLGMIKFAHWTQESRLNILERFSEADQELKLHMRPISAVTLKDHPYSDLNEDGGKLKATGFIVEMFTEILHDLRADLRLKLNDDLQFGEFVNGSWSGVVGALCKRKADLALVKLGMTKDRISSIRFSAPVHRGNMVIVMRRPTDTVSNSYFQPFHIYVWIVLHLLLLATALVLCVCHVYNSRDGNCDGAEFRGWFVMEFLAGSVLMDVFFGEIRGISSRILFVTLGVTAYLVSSHYGCDFMSTRTTQNDLTPFNNLDELSADDDYVVTFVRSLSIYEIFKNAPRGTAMSKIWTRLIDNDLNDLVVNLPMGLDKAYSGHYALLVDNKVAETAVRDNCSFFITPSVYSICFYHIGARLDFPYTKLISTTLVQMMEHGIVDMYAKRHLQMVPSSCKAGVAEKVAFGLSNIIEPLVILLVGFVISLFMLSVEILVYRVSRVGKVDKITSKKKNFQKYIFKSDRFQKIAM